MKMCNLNLLPLVLGLLVGTPSVLPAQTYAINWYNVSGGGGASSNGLYVLNGSIGQEDAGGPLTGGIYSLIGGFWAFNTISVSEMPLLHVSRSGPSAVLVWWLSGSGSYTPQICSDLKPGNWGTYGGPITSSGGTNSVIFSPPDGILFFRLSSP